MSPEISPDTSRFLRLPDEYSSLQTSRFVIFPVPYDLMVTFIPGARFAPRAIIEVSEQLELYDEELECEPYRLGIHTLPPLEITTHSPESMMHRIQRAAEALVKSGRIVVMLGGDHSITYPMVRAVMGRLGSDFGVLQLDAHADLRDTYEDSPYNHACVGRRILDLGLPLVAVGTRSMSAEERDFAAGAEKLTTFRMKDIRREGLDQIIPSMIKAMPEKIYISLDLDVFDPSVMPSVGTPEPGGLSWEEVNRLVREVIAAKDVIGIDVTEFCPIAGLVAPEYLVARLIYRMFACLACRSSEVSP
jgi:agmatinase